MRETQRKEIQTLPKTSQLSPWTFKKIFEEELKKSEKILCTTLISKLLGL
jgi:fatty acid-binding protein DegV